MKAQEIPSVTVEEELRGEPISVDGLTLEPVAQLKARIWSQTVADQSGGAGQFAAALVRVTPERVMVYGRPGGEQEVAITDATTQSLKGIGIGMLAVAGVCLLLIFIRKLLP